MRVHGRVAVVTGAEGGLGRALALALARRGARLAVCGLTPEPLQRLQAAIEAAGGRAVAATCDVRDAEHVARLVADTARLLGSPDLLVNNAGITLGGDIRLLTEDEWVRTLEVNLLGAVRMVKAVLPGMLAQRRGTIVNVASAAGLAAPALWIPYAASKFALVGLSEGLHAALRPRGIGVSVVCPMWLQTDMLTSTTPRLSDPPPRERAGGRPPAVWAWLGTRARGRPMSPDLAAERIVRGVERERFMIYTHRTTRLLVLARALAPEMFARLWGRVNELDEHRRRQATG